MLEAFSTTEKNYVSEKEIDELIKMINGGSTSGELSTKTAIEMLKYH